MKKPAVDYRDFSLSRINEPRFCHLKLLWAWVIYFFLYVITELFVPVESCTIVHCALDDRIPFHELFIIPYVLWYLLVAFSLLYFALYDVDGFQKLMKFIIITQVVAMAAYIFLPSRQELRPEVFPRDNLLSGIVKIIYTLDTNTNVCPSMHAAFSLAIASTWLKSPVPKKGSKALVAGFALLVCVSTVFVKQHSVLDVLAAVLVCLLAEILVFGKSYWRAKGMGMA